MPDEIAIISDLMFPVTMLPDCLLSFIKMRCRLPSLELVSIGVVSGFALLYPTYETVVLHHALLDRTTPLF